MHHLQILISMGIERATAMLLRGAASTDRRPCLDCDSGPIESQHHTCARRRARRHSVATARWECVARRARARRVPGAPHPAAEPAYQSASARRRCTLAHSLRRTREPAAPGHRIVRRSCALLLHPCDLLRDGRCQRLLGQVRRRLYGYGHLSQVRVYGDDAMPEPLRD